MNLDLEPPSPIRTRRLKSGVPVDVYDLPSGGVLYVPTIPDWELQQQRRERAGREAESRSH
jgi:hypothetical protein